MNNKTIYTIAATLFLTGAAIFMSFKPASETITMEGDTTVINTQTIGKNIEGYNGAVPVKIYIRKNKVVKVEALRNQETPKYFARAKTLLTKWDGLTINKAQKQEVDGVSGATYSSEALIKNVQLGLKYYKEHR